MIARPITYAEYLEAMEKRYRFPYDEHMKKIEGRALFYTQNDAFRRRTTIADLAF